VCDCWYCFICYTAQNNNLDNLITNFFSSFSSSLLSLSISLPVFFSCLSVTRICSIKKNTWWLFLNIYLLIYEAPKRTQNLDFTLEASNLYTYYLSLLAFFRKDPCFKIFNAQFLYKKINVLTTPMQSSQRMSNRSFALLWHVQINSSARYCAEIFQIQKRSLTCNFLKINRPIHKKIEWKLFKQWLTSEIHN